MKEQTKTPNLRSNASDERDEIIATKDQQIEQLSKKVGELTALIQYYEEQFRLSQQKRFGASSEKTGACAGEQLSFDASIFNEPEQLADKKIEEPILEQVAPYTRKKTVGKREADLTGLPVEQVMHTLSEAERICPACGSPLHICGHDVLRRELTVIPAQVKVTEHVQEVGSCRNCEQNATSVPMVKAHVPAPLIRGSGVASPILVAYIAHQKYVLALPLYRQEQELKRLGVNLSRQTMANWLIYGHTHYLQRIYETLRLRLVLNEVLHADETTLQVLHEDGKPAKSKSYMWLYQTSGDTDEPIILFEYKDSRSSAHPIKFLKDFRGYLHTDGYGGYHSIDRVTVVGCWVHMRRMFADIIKTLPKENIKGSGSKIGLDYCNALFMLEREYEEQKLTFEERQTQRLEKSKPIADEFFAWAVASKSKTFPHMAIGKAIAYALNQQKWLMNVFLDGRLELSNNRAENSIRPFVVGRKNWLFSNTPKGATSSAAYYSLVETAKANHLDPCKYLQFLFESIPQLETNNSLDHCLPWSENVRRVCGGV